MCVYVLIKSYKFVYDITLTSEILSETHNFMSFSDPVLYVYIYVYYILSFTNIY